MRRPLLRRRAIRIISIVPGSAAHKCGLLEIHDQLVSVEDENVFGWSLKAVRQSIHGTPGTHVTLDFMRERRDTKIGQIDKTKFRVNLMRGSPQYIQYQDLFGPANASQLDQLVLQKREEQKFNSMVGA
jgi:C-terminal processing protease CtpA/Prc